MVDADDKTRSSPDTDSHDVLQRVGFSDLPGWMGDDHLAAFQAFRVSALRMQQKPYGTRRLGVSGAELARIGRLALEASVSDSVEARLFFERHFIPKRVHIGGRGHLTGYYEPVIAASRTRSELYRTPLLRRPDDLIDIDDGNRPEDMDAEVRFGRRLPAGRLAMYHDRKAIESGALEGQGLEIAWVADPMDAYFIHIQGSAKLLMDDGTVRRITFAAKSGHAYQSIGKIMIRDGHMKTADVTMAGLRRWFADNPERRTDITWQNPSYIFFEEFELDHLEDGPVAAAKTPLIAGRSMAVDRLLHTFGTPVWISPHTALPGEATPISRLMIAQDTGSAIIGPARGDFFTGSGEAAGFRAGAINHGADFFVLAPASQGMA